MRAVWQGSNKKNEVVAYIKYGTKEEINRTIEFDKIIKERNMRAKYNLLEIEYPSVLAKGAEEFPTKLSADLARRFKKLRAKNPRFYMVDTPFAMTQVDVSGVSYYYVVGSDLSVLGGAAITDKEWVQVVNFFKELNEAGFYHTDLYHNLYFKRTPSGKLKMTLLDFDFFDNNIQDIENLKVIEKKLIFTGLKTGKSTAVYNTVPSSFKP